jgi:hypothetical protein
MSTFIERLHEEKIQLDEKINKLTLFTNSDKFNEVTDIQKSLLTIQLNAMETYSACLHERIADLNKYGES